MFSLEKIIHNKKIIYLVDQFSVSSVNFLTIIFFANFLSLEEQSVFGYIFYAYFFLLLVNVALFFVISPVLKHLEYKNIKNYFNFLFNVQLVLALILTIIVIIFIEIFSSLSNFSIDVLTLLFIGLFYFFQQIAEFIRRSSIVFENIFFDLKSNIFLYLIRVTLILYIKPSTLKDAIFILAITSMLPILINLRFLIKQIDLKSIICWRKYTNHFKQSTVALTSSTISWFLFFSPVYILGFYHTQLVSFFVSIRSITNFSNIILEFLETIVPSFLARKYYKNGSKSFSENLNLIYFFGGAIWIIFFILFITFHEIIITIILGQNYAFYSYLLMFFWIQIGIHFLSRIYGLKYRIKNILKYDLYAHITALISLLLCIKLIIDNDIIGTTYVLMIISITILISQIIFIKVFHEKKISKG